MIKYYLRIPSGGYLHFRGSGGHTYITLTRLEDATALPDEQHAIEAAEHATEFLITGDFVEIVKIFVKVQGQDD